MPDMPETIGPYTILGRLGAGGMSEVFSARDKRLKRRVAIKRLNPDTPLSGERLARFRREAQLAARLNHPAIVQIHDVLEHDGSELIVMEFVDGENLAQHLTAGPLPLAPLLQMALDVADGLAAAHREGIIHRDLKTENVLITAGGRAKITDFGIAKNLEPDPGDARLTATYAVVGTNRSMAPEQVNGEAVDERSDLHAFGVLLYEALTGRSPFLASSVARTVNNILELTPPPVSEIDPRVPPELSRLVACMLQKDPDLRPRHATDVRDILRRIATQAGVVDAEAPLSRTEAPCAPTRTGRRFRRLAVAAVALVVIAVAAATHCYRESSPKAVSASRAACMTGRSTAS